MMDHDSSPLDEEVEAFTGRNRRSVLRLAVLLESALLLAAAALVWLTGLRPAIEAGPASLLAGATAGAATAGIAILLAGSSWGPFLRIRRDFETFIRLFSGASVRDLTIVSLLAGICEEAFFRGLIQTWMAARAGPHIAVAVTAALFGLTHAISLPYAAFVTALGIAFGYLYYTTGSLPGVMLAHAVYDFAVLYWGTRVIGPRLT